jgi:tetratricopeptide (TPR) repeat protein
MNSNVGFGDGLDIRFEPLGWEDTLASTGRRSQAVINQEIERCDVFILAMHRRWGQAAPDAQPYSSYAEEEFHRALALWQKKRREKPQASEIFVFFKHIDPGQMADPGPQLQKVLDFRRSLEESRQVLYHGFANEDEFKAEVDRHLRAFAKDELPQTDAPRDEVLLPLAVLAEVQKEKAEKERALARAEHSNEIAEAAVARVETFALEIAERAPKAALEGRVEEARQDFAKATDGTANLWVLNLAYEFYYRTADLATAEELLERCLAISGRDSETADTANALGNLGLIYWRRGELDQAEEMHRKALGVHEKLGFQEGMVNQHGNLGAIYQTRGELDRAEDMFHDVLNIEKKLGRQESIANAYCNLGLICQARDDLDGAEEMHRNSLAIYKTLGSQEGTASEYGNLGLIYRKRDKLDQAEKMHRKALAIQEKLGSQEGMANSCGNLGLIYQTRCDLDRAEEMHLKALAINENLGLQGGMANTYANLGSVAIARGDMKRARELWAQARDLFAKIGMRQLVAKVQANLDELPAAKSKRVRSGRGKSKAKRKKKKT